MKKLTQISLSMTGLMAFACAQVPSSSLDSQVQIFDCDSSQSATPAPQTMDFYMTVDRAMIDQTAVPATIISPATFYLSYIPGESPAMTQPQTINVMNNNGGMTSAQCQVYTFPMGAMNVVGILNTPDYNPQSPKTVYFNPFDSGNVNGTTQSNLLSFGVYNTFGLNNANHSFSALGSGANAIPFPGEPTGPSSPVNAVTLQIFYDSAAGLANSECMAQTQSGCSSIPGNPNVAYTLSCIQDNNGVC
jgi:hypothetical protein